MTTNFAILWKHKLTLIVWSVIGLAAGIGYLQIATPTYHGQARVLIAPQDVTPELGNEGRVDPEFLPTQVETIRSPVTIRRALKSVPVTPPPGSALEEFDPVRHVLDSLTVTPVLKANVVTMTYRSADPDELLGLLSSIIEAYRHDVSDMDMGNTVTNTEIIAARERSLRKDLETVQREYDELRCASPVLGQGREANEHALAKLNEITNQLADVQRQRAELQTRLDMMTRGVSLVSTQKLPEPAGAIAANHTRPVIAWKPQVSESEPCTIEDVLQFAEPGVASALQDLQNRHRFAQLRVAQLDEAYGPRHPEMIDARAEVAELEALLQQRLDEIGTAWRHQLSVVEATERELEKNYQAEQRVANAAEAYLVKEEFLRGNIARIEDLHSATATQLITMQSAAEAIAGGRTSIDVRVLDGPVLLPEMTWPQPKMLLPAFTCLGFAAGFCFVLLRDFQKGGGNSITLASTRSGVPVALRHESNGDDRAAPAPAHAGTGGSV